MLKRLLQYLVLPSQVTRFERDYLARMNRIALLFLFAQVPPLVAVAALSGTGALKAAGLALLTLVGPVAAYLGFRNPRSVTRVFAVAGMCLGGLLVHFGQGPMQIEMHFYFFVLLALLAVFADPMVILIGAATVALHHVTLFALLPRSVFNYDASLWAVAVHALFLVLESVGACFVARSFFDSMIGLERNVGDRTQQLAQRSDELRLMLDTIEQGVLTFDRAGRVAPERSAVLATWLGPCAPGASVWAYIARGDARLAARFEFGWQAVLDDVLPVELALDQMPQRMVVDGRVLELAYRPIGASGAVERALLLVSDITSRVERERYEEENAEIISVCERILFDRAGFVEFLSDADALVRTVAAPASTGDERRRALHTLKGNCGLSGLPVMARNCHALEDAIAEADELCPAQVENLVTRWRSLHEKIIRLFGEERRGRIELSELEHARLTRAVVDGAPRAEIVRALEGLKLEPVDARLARLADKARVLAERLGKGGVTVRVESNSVRLARADWAPLWSALVHTISNALDHGIEAPDERVAAGKAPTGALDLSTAIEAGAFVFELRDDGRGVDWERVRARALTRGLPAASHEDLVEALFSNGLSTRDEASQYSGRGIGMGALRAVCEDFGGALRVESERGRGTRIEVRIPYAPAAASCRPTFVSASVAPRNDVSLLSAIA
jgi:HPt (histidine-containing phosphotransfer) domain-containing protein/two-component sensor histidine kinase